MQGITVTMAIIDFIPVIMFFISAVILQRDLYNKMVKGRFALLAAGSIMVLTSGFYKAIWKALVALGICDFTALNVSFFPIQGPGFLLVFLSLLGKDKSDEVRIYDVATATLVSYTSNIIFIVMNTVGLAGAQFCLVARAAKMKKPVAVVLFIISFIFMLGMGYLGAKFDSTSKMNWIAQATNIVSQGSLLAGVLILHKAGLAK